MLRIRKPKGIIFDCDGCLLDSEKIFLDAVIEYLGTMGIKERAEDIVFILGKRMPEIAKELIDRYRLDTTVEKLVEDERKIFHAVFGNMKLEPMPYLLDFINKAKEEGIRIAIASSSPKRYLDDVTGRLGIRELFDVIVAGDEVENGKPAPDIYLLAAKKLDIDKSKLLIIEDSVSGIKAGIDSKIMTVGYKGSVVVQDTSNADVIVDSYKDIIW